MRLLRAEMWRFRSRLLVRWIAAGSLALAALIVFTAYTSSAPMPADQVAQMRVDYDLQVQDWEENGEQYLADCAAEAEKNGSTAQEWGCTAESYGPGDFEDWTGSSQTFGWDAASPDGAATQVQTGVDGEPLPPELRSDPPVGMQAVDGQAWSGVAGVAGAMPLFVLLALVLGVTFGAAEMSSGAISNWLTFEPRRRRVFWSKATAAGIGVLPIAAVAIAATGLGSWAAYRFNDALGTMGSEQWEVLVASMGRTLAAAVVFAVLGVSLGVLLRHTAIVAGVVIGWIVVVELVLGNNLSALKPYLLMTSLTAWIENGANYYETVCTFESGAGQTCQDVGRTVSLLQGGLVLAAVVALVTLVSVLVFRRRDVG